MRKTILSIVMFMTYSSLVCASDLTPGLAPVEDIMVSCTSLDIIDTRLDSIRLVMDRVNNDSEDVEYRKKALTDISKQLETLVKLTNKCLSIENYFTNSKAYSVIQNSFFRMDQEHLQKNVP